MVTFLINELPFNVLPINRVIIFPMKTCVIERSPGVDQNTVRSEEEAVRSSYPSADVRRSAPS